MGTNECLISLENIRNNVTLRRVRSQDDLYISVLKFTIGILLTFRNLPKFDNPPSQPCSGAAARQFHRTSMAVGSDQLHSRLSTHFQKEMQKEISFFQVVIRSLTENNCRLLFCRNAKKCHTLLKNQIKKQFTPPRGDRNDFATSKLF